MLELRNQLCGSIKASGTVHPAEIRLLTDGSYRFSKEALEILKEEKEATQKIKPLEILKVFFEILLLCHQRGDLL